MAEFKTIESQEQFDEAIKERIARVEKSTREAVEKEFSTKYSDYEDVKKKNTEYEEQISKFEETKKDYESKLAEDSKKIEELNTQSKAHETNSVKMRIALEKGLPYELATRLNGASVEEIEKDAESLLKMVGKPIAPISSNEPTSYEKGNDGDMRQIVAGMLKNKNKD